MNIAEIKTQKCRHIFTAGNRCQSPALRNQPFCYFHHDQRDPVSRQTLADRRAHSAYFDFNIPDPTDRLAIQLAILEVAQRLAANSLDAKRAGRILYALQMVLYANPRPARETTPTKQEIVEETVTDPTYGTLAPETEIAPPKRSAISELLQSMTEGVEAHKAEQARLKAQQQPATQPETTILPQLQAVATKPCRGLSFNTRPGRTRNQGHRTHPLLATAQSAKIVSVSKQLKKLTILGSTGSIGQSTLSICESFPDRYTPIALAAGSNLEVAFAQCQRWRPKVISIATEQLSEALKTRLKAVGLAEIEVVHGTAGTIHVATLPEVDFVVSAIVGVAGLEATYAAVCAGKTIGLANKECLVAAGELILAAAAKHNVALLPIDSEHNAVHQAMRGGTPAEVKQVWLTASGGPFRNTPAVDFAHITPAQALKHPTWVMGQRITIDSATMMNKGFEVIEACRLFHLPPAQVRVTIHPQSTVHSLVEFVDGSILAQISVTDMRLPILYALAYPERVAVSEKEALTFDLATLSQLDFSQPDLTRFPCLRLAYEAAETGGTACIALNAADEVAVAAFLAHKIPFMGIPSTIEQVLSLTPARHPESIKDVLEADAAARICAESVIAQQAAARI